jgi:hypothetical protein
MPVPAITTLRKHRNEDRIHEEPLIVQRIDVCKNIEAQAPFRLTILAISEHAGPAGPF